MKRFFKAGRSGFTMVELLIVLVIIGILAAVSAPIYSANTKRANASDAVAAMSLIRQAEREYALRNIGAFHVVTDGNLYGDTALNVDLKTAQYFSNAAFGVSTSASAFKAAGTTGLVGNPTAPQDFLITANGYNSADCSAATSVNCAVKAVALASRPGTDLGKMCLEMDNTGRIFINFNANPSGTTNCSGNPTQWEAY
jgi:prepilin-type N-terminal cleavage/methylation domain-containing protein